MWDIKPCIPLRVNRYFGGIYHSIFRFEASIKEETSVKTGGKQICSSETSIHSQQTTRRCIPEDRSLHNYCCENLNSYKNNFIQKTRCSGRYSNLAPPEYRALSLYQPARYDHVELAMFFKYWFCEKINETFKISIRLVWH